MSIMFTQVFIYRVVAVQRHKINDDLLISEARMHPVPYVSLRTSHVPIYLVWTACRLPNPQYLFNYEYFKNKYDDDIRISIPLCKVAQHTHTHTHTHTLLTALCPGLSGWAGTRTVKPIWILLKQETVSGSGISWVIRKSAPHSRQITTPAPHHSVIYRPDAFPAAQPTASKHWISNNNK